MPEPLLPQGAEPGMTALRVLALDYNPVVTDCVCVRACVCVCARARVCVWTTTR